jgi:hypothetical protein
MPKNKLDPDFRPIIFRSKFSLGNCSQLAKAKYLLISISICPKETFSILGTSLSTLFMLRGELLGPSMRTV